MSIPDLFEGPNIAHVATLMPDGAPHSVPMWVGVEGDAAWEIIDRIAQEVVKRRLDSLQPWPEAGTGDNIAGAALFLASDDAAFVTGEALIVDGGLTAMGPALPRRMRPTEPDDLGAQFQFVGVDKGSTGEPPVIRKLEPRG